jgi:ABC-type transporter Mla subunit MlaD
MATTPESLFEDLKNALKEFKEFLDQNVNVIKPAIAALKSLVPQIGELLEKLVELMGKLKTEIQNLNVNAIPGLAEASQFTEMMKNFLTSMKTLLPNEADEIDSVLEVANLVTGLPSLDAVKAEILALIDALVAHLNNLKTA